MKKKLSLKKINLIKSLAIFLIGIFLAIIVYPDFYVKIFKTNPPKFLQIPFRLGLDLQGGTHLVYEADMSKVPKSRRKEAIQGVRDVIERRVNTFGISEPVIQVNKSANHWRLIVELAGIKDVNQAIKMIGQTPLLEFKELNNEPPRDLTDKEKQELKDYNNKQKELTKNYLKQIKKNQEEFDKIKQEILQTKQVKISKDGKVDLTNIDTSKSVQENIKVTKYNQYSDLYQQIQNYKEGFIPKVIETNNSFNLIKINKIEEQKDKKEVKASHLLVCFKGKKNCNKDRTKEQAKKLIEEIKSKINTRNFEKLVAKYSDEPGAKDRKGDLGWFTKGRMVKPFEDAVFSMKKNTISDIVETEFGFHLIYKKDERNLKTFIIDRIILKKKTKQDILPPPEIWKNTELTGKHLQRAVVDFDPNTGEPMINLIFNKEGKKLFAEITKRNLKKPLAIFLDGQSIIDTDGDGKITKNDIYAPRIESVIKEGRAQITGSLNIERAKLIARRLNSGALPVPIKLINQQTVGASLGAKSVQISIKAGIIGLILVMIFMLVYYRLPGLTAVLSLLLYSLILLTIFKLIPITLTLSGIAGFILSIGMAVDANVLIFERIKEELKLGKTLYSAINDGFKRAWPSIRDGNISTLITCIILMSFGTGMIKGFAITLGLGVIVSMFSAIILTKIFIYAFSPERLTIKTKWLFLGAKK